MDLRKLPALELLRICLTSGNEEAWAEFVRRFQPLIAAVAFKTSRRFHPPSPSLVDDLVHDTYVKIFEDNCKALREFNPHHENALFGFLRVIASNVTQDYWRRKLSEKRGSGKGEESLGENEEFLLKAKSPDRSEREVLRREIKQALEKLFPGPGHARDRAIFEFYYEQGYTAKEISELPMVRLTIKEVENLLLRIIRMIRSEFFSGGM